MSEEDALLAAIYANHDDDTPRLVYADWLDEHDQPERAEFIRVQIELASQEDQRSAEFSRLWNRQDELLKAHEKEWTAHLGSFDREKVWFDFRRGFPDQLTVRDGAPADFRIISRVPGLRRLDVEGGALSPAVLRAVAALSQLDALSIYSTPFRTAWLRLLDPLPFWTYVRIESDAGGFERAFEAFQERRIGKMGRAPLAAIRECAHRFVAAVSNTNPLPRPPIKAAHFSQMGICDAELQLVSYLTELESVNIFQGNETEAGLRHLARLPNLRSVDLGRSPVNSIIPLTARTQLERLGVFTDGGTLTDEGTEGLERLSNLQHLQLYGGGETLRDGTVRRLAPLKQLRSLELYIGELEEDSLSAIAGHTKLESLRLEGPVTDNDLRHCARLTNLTFLSINGNRATDAALLHLTRLTKLRTLMAQSGYMGERSGITEPAARVLADQLPEVTIILDRHVVKSPRKTITLRRRHVDNVASALFPVHWGRNRSVSDRWDTRLTEDGWDNVGSWSGGVVGPAEIDLYVWNDKGGNSAKAAMTANVRNNAHAKPRILERDVVKVTYKDAVSCVYRNDFGQHLVCAVATGSNCVVVHCEAPSARFEEFRPLFEFVARSLRVGKAAMKNVGEEKTVAVSRL